MTASESNPDGRVLWQVQNGVGHIVLDRPNGANALSLPMARQLAAAVLQAAQSDVGAVLISARGKQFCAGGDIREFVANVDRFDALASDILALAHPSIHQLTQLPVPVVSALQGPVGGAGIAMALCADIVLASSAMFMRGGYSAIGLSPDLGASYFLARRSNPARAKYVLMTNRPISAEQCLAWGLIDELHARRADAGSGGPGRTTGRGRHRIAGWHQTPVRRCFDPGFAHPPRCRARRLAALLHLGRWTRRRSRLRGKTPAAIQRSTLDLSWGYWRCGQGRLMPRPAHAPCMSRSLGLVSRSNGALI